MRQGRREGIVYAGGLRPAMATCPTRSDGSGSVATGTSTVTDRAIWNEYVVNQLAWDEEVVDYWYYETSDRFTAMT